MNNDERPTFNVESVPLCQSATSPRADIQTLELKAFIQLDQQGLAVIRKDLKKKAGLYKRM